MLVDENFGLSTSGLWAILNSWIIFYDQLRIDSWIIIDRFDLSTSALLDQHASAASLSNILYGSRTLALGGSALCTYLGEN